MIILDFFRENCIGNIIRIDIRSFSTNYLFQEENPDYITTKDISIEGLPKRLGDY